MQWCSLDCHHGIRRETSSVHDEMTLAELDRILEHVGQQASCDYKLPLLVFKNHLGAQSPESSNIVEEPSGKDVNGGQFALDPDHPANLSLLNHENWLLDCYLSTQRIQVGKSSGAVQEMASTVVAELIAGLERCQSLWRAAWDIQRHMKPTSRKVRMNHRNYIDTSELSNLALL